MATIEALGDIQQQQKQTLAAEYGGKMSNQFVAELKSSTLFQFDWSELLAAAPTALSLMGACWIAASHPTAYQVSMEKAVPQGGFKYLTNKKNPTLRSCLVDVCNIGGRAAFVTASANMDALQIRSTRICSEKIDLVFKRLGPCTKNADALDDFKDALSDFANEAQQCAKLATETREAFTRWGRMVGELHAATEQQQGITSIDRETLSIEEQTAEIEKKFAQEAVESVKEQVQTAANTLSKAEKRLDTAIDNVPSPLTSMVTGIVSSFTQALPNIVGAALPAVMAAANPAGAMTNAVLGGLSQAVKNGTPSDATNGAASPSMPTINDPAYTAAAGVQELANHFYEYLGGDKGNIDWAKFTDTKGASAGSSGTTYFIATFKGNKSKIDVTNTDSNKQLLGALDKLIQVATSIQAYQREQTDMSAAKLSPETLDSWKSDAKAAKTEIIRLASVASSLGSNNAPVAFGAVKADLAQAGASAQNAAFNSAMQGVQMAQNAVDTAQTNYDAAMSKQAKTAAAMAEVEKKLKRLQESGQTLDEIKSILRDCISVLVDLAIQVGKLEKFFTMLTTVIDHVVLPRAETFVNTMNKQGERALRNSIVNVDDIAKQTIYTSTLQLKAYFSLLADISGMYSRIDHQYIMPGTELCMKLSAGAASNDPMEKLQADLAKFTEESSKAVAAEVKQKQDAMLSGLKDRARKAAESTQLIENTVREKGLVVDDSAKKAIEQGATQAKQAAQAVIDAKPAVTSEEIDSSAL